MIVESPALQNAKHALELKKQALHRAVQQVKVAEAKRDEARRDLVAAYAAVKALSQYDNIPAAMDGGA